EEALAEAGVQLDAPVTASFKNFTLRAALYHVLGNDELHFEFGANELIVGIAAPGAAQPGLLIPLHAPLARDAGLRPPLEIRVGGGGSFGVAMINGVQIQCEPVVNLDDVDAAPPVREDAPPPKLQITFAKGTVERLLFTVDRNTTKAQARHLALLDRRI